MKKLSSIFAVILTFFVFCLAIFFIYTQQDNKDDKKTYTYKENSPIVSKSNLTAKEFKSEITFGAVGDILIHNSVYEDAYSNGQYDFTPMFGLVKDAMSLPDITFANQETILGGTELGLSSYPQFNSPYEVGDALKDIGVDIVSMANNHTLDVGEQGILNATAYFDKLGIPYVGAYSNFADQNKPRILSKDGIKVGFLAYTYGTNGLIRPEDKPYLVQYIDDGKLLDDIKELKPQVDFVVVSLHFGLEYQRLANDVQKLLVEEVSNAGADIILGHHPHVLQPVDWIEKENGEKTFVIYSLGNFLSGQAELYQRIGAVLHLQLGKEITNNETLYKISNVQVMPTYNYRPNYRNYKIVPLYDADSYGLSNAKQLFKEMEAHMKSYTDDVEVVEQF